MIKHGILKNWQITAPTRSGDGERSIILSFPILSVGQPVLACREAMASCHNSHLRTQIWREAFSSKLTSTFLSKDEKVACCAMRAGVQCHGKAGSQEKELPGKYSSAL